jgi:hypothetical protein
MLRIEIDPAPESRIMFKVTSATSNPAQQWHVSVGTAKKEISVISSEKNKIGYLPPRHKQCDARV